MKIALQILQRIARYFRVTVTELESREYTTTEMIDINKLLNKQLQKDASIKMFPIISNEDCLKNEKFKKSYSTCFGSDTYALFCRLF